MASINDIYLDAGLTQMGTDGDTVHLCTQEPTTFAEATSTFSIGSAAATAGAPGDRAAGGREITVTASEEVTFSATGTATHWAFVDTNNSRLVAVQTMASTFDSPGVGTTRPLGDGTVFFDDPA